MKKVYIDSNTGAIYYTLKAARIIWREEYDGDDPTNCASDFWVLFETDEIPDDEWIDDSEWYYND